MSVLQFACMYVPPLQYAKNNQMSTEWPFCKDADPSHFVKEMASGISLQQAMLFLRDLSKSWKTVVYKQANSVHKLLQNHAHYRELFPTTKFLIKP